MQAVEAFHRLTDSSSVTDPVNFREIRDDVKKAIVDRCGESEISSRLIEAINFANELTLQRRIESLFSRIERRNLKQLLRDPESFAQVVRQTRNFLTHAGTKRKTNVVSDPGKLFLLNQELQAFLRLLVLLHLEVPETLVFEPVFRQSRKWR